MSDKKENQRVLGNSLGQRIKQLRMQKRLTQIELAKGLCTPSMISQIESDTAKPSYRVLSCIADKLETSMDHLLEGVELNLEITSTYKMAMAMLRSKEYASAITLFDELAEKPRAVVSTVELQFQLGKCHLGMGHYDEALQLFGVVFDTANLKKDQRMLTEVLMNLATLYKCTRKYQLAEHYVEKAQEEFDMDEEQDSTLRVWLLTEAAAVYQEIGKLHEAQRNFVEAAELSADWMNVEVRSKLFLEMAHIYRELGDFEKCNEYAMRALVLTEQIEAENKYMELRKSLELLNQSEVWQEKIHKLLEFVQFFENKQEHNQAGEIYAEIAAICLENSQNENNALAETWGYAEKARLILPHDHEATAKAHRVLSSVHFARGNVEKGRKHLENAIVIYEQHGLLSKYEETILQMCDHLIRQGEVEAAFQRLQNFQDYLVAKLEERGIVL